MRVKRNQLELLAYPNDIANATFLSPAVRDACYIRVYILADDHLYYKHVGTYTTLLRNSASQYFTFELYFSVHCSNSFHSDLLTFVLGTCLNYGNCMSRVGF